MDHHRFSNSGSGSPDRRDAPLGVILWGMVSLTALAFPAMRIPMWARVSPPAEQYALPMMLVVQVGLMAMLFPGLLSGARSALMVAGGSSLLLQLAGLLGDAPWGEVGQAIGWFWMWTGSLWLISRTLHSARAQHIGVAVATTAAIGAMILIYLRREFRSDVNVGNSAFLWLVLTGVLIGSGIYGLVRSRQPIND